jgi:hypothetical protein
LASLEVNILDGLKKTARNVRIVCNTVEIPTRYLPNARLERYFYTNVLG